METDPAPLDKARHLKYWTRSLRSFLPWQYTSNDSTRLTLAFFIVAGIDLLTSPSDSSSPDENLLPSPITSADRRNLRQWVLSCKHPAGGFCGSPNMVPPPFSADDYDTYLHAPTAGSPESANIASTFFALLLLALAAETDGYGAFTRVDRKKTLRWLKRLQRADGSFGEIVTPDGFVGGGRDMRYCYLAASIRWCLLAPEEQGSPELDIDVDALVAYVRAGATYDGGLAESSRHESHAGYAFCGTATLFLLDRPADARVSHTSALVADGIPDMTQFVRFQMARPFVYLPASSEAAAENDDPNFVLPARLGALSLGDDDDDPEKYVAFNGRANKVADTCYAWWSGGALVLTHQLDLLAPVTKARTRAFLLDKTQHMVGGFSKHPGGPPDLYHAYLGLGALATLDRTPDALPEFDVALCVRLGVVERIEKARGALVETEKVKAEEGEGQKRMGDSLLEMGKAMVGREVSWLTA